MAKRRGLGRGLDALLAVEKPAPAAETPPGAGASVESAPIEALAPNRYQPRREFAEDALAELADSIQSQGVIQPILVTPRAEGGYMILAGERRWRAARKAGLESVPIAVRAEASERDMLEIALVENIQRSDLNVLEEAEAFERLSQEFGLSHAEIASRVGKSRASISNTLRLLSLPEPVKALLREGSLSAGQARPLVTLRDREARIRLAQRAVRDRLSARRLEELAQAAADEAAGSDKQASSKDVVDPDTQAAEEKLTRKLQTKVAIRRRGQGGKVVIAFHSEEDLMRLYEVLMG